MATPAKFLFDDEFGRGGKSGRGQPTQRQAELAEAEARGHRNGLAAGRAEATAEAARGLAGTMAAAAAALERIAHEMKAIEYRLETEAVEVAFAAAGRLSTELVRQQPFVEIAALVGDCFRHLVAVPHVVVRVSSEVFDEAQQRLDEIAAACGFGGRVVVLAEPDIAPGDCRIEWADGGASRDRAAIEATIAEAVERYIAVRRAAPGTGSSEVSL